MNQIAVEIVEDTQRPEGGHAIIRLRGLNVLPSPSDYKIEPVDGLANMTETSDWPLGARQPVEARVTEQGVELVAGPDVVESPHLLPGTPVVISIPAAGIEAEVLWPTVTPLARTERRPVIAVGDVLAAAAQKHIGLNGTVNGLNGGAALNGNANGEKPAAVLSSLSVRANGAGIAGIASGSPAGQAEASGANMEAAKGSVQRAEQSPMAEGARGPSGSMRARASVRRLPLQRALREPAAGETNRPADERATEERRFYPIQPYEPPAGMPPANDRTSRKLAGVAIAVAMVAALSSILGNLLRPGPAPAIVTAAAETKNVTGRQPVAVPSAYDVVTTSPRSPLGVSTEGVTLAKALEMADQRLHGPASGRDGNEGAFWLKRAVAVSLGDQRTLWALTQLGSLYAEPLQGDPDYAKARMLWQLAGGLGDPVALCFLGSMSEFGIGGGIDKAAALSWYERAKRAGGCKQIDEALKRVRQ